MTGSKTDITEKNEQTNEHTDLGVLAEVAGGEAGQTLPPLGEDPVTAEQQQQEPEVPTAEVLQAVIHPAFVLLAPNWNVQPEESAALAEAYAPVIDKYFPDAGSGMGPELMAVTVSLAVLGPRLAIPRKAQAQEVTVTEPEPKTHSAPEAKPAEPEPTTGVE